MIEGREPGERGQLLGIGLAEFGHEREQDLGGDRTDPGSARKQASLRVWTCKMHANQLKFDASS